MIASSWNSAEFMGAMQHLADNYRNSCSSLKASKAKKQLGWEPQITAREMCAEMVLEDLKTARRHAILKEHELGLPASIQD